MYVTVRKCLSNGTYVLAYINISICDVGKAGSARRKGEAHALLEARSHKSKGLGNFAALGQIERSRIFPSGPVAREELYNTARLVPVITGASTLL